MLRAEAIKWNPGNTSLGSNHLLVKLILQIIMQFLSFFISVSKAGKELRSGVPLHMHTFIC